MTEEKPGYPDYGKVNYTERLDEPEFKRYIAILRRRIWALAIVFIVIVTVGTIHAFKATPIYRGIAKILIEKQSPRVMKMEEVMPLQVSGQDYYKTQRELIRSRTVMEMALQEPGISELFKRSAPKDQESSFFGEVKQTVLAALGTEPGIPPEPWELLRKKIKVEQVRDSHLLLVQADDKEALRAAKLANAVARSFEKFHVERKLRTTSDAFHYLEEQKAKQENELLNSENALQKFREQAQEVSLDVSDKSNPVLVRLSRLNNQLTEVQLERIELETQFKVVEKTQDPESGDLDSANEELFNLAVVRADPTIAEGRAKLIEAEKERVTLSDIYGPDHPQLQAAQARVSLLRTKLEQALKQLVGSLSAQLEMLKNQEEELRQEYEQQNQLAMQLARRSLEFNRLQYDVQRKRKLFDVLVERMREVDVTGDFAKTNVEVVETADVPKAPVKPQKARIILLSLVLGLLFGTGLAFFFEYLDDTVKTPDDLEERVGIPVLGFVPGMNGKAKLGDGFFARGAVCLAEPKSAATEAYRNIRTSLFFSAPAEETKVLVITSGGPGDGKSTTATNLALIVAQSGKGVLLIDADFRKPMVHKIFNLNQDKGLSTVLVGQANLEEALQKVQFDGKAVDKLDVLVSGPTPPNPAELLDSRSMRDFLK